MKSKTTFSVSLVPTRIQIQKPLNFNAKGKQRKPEFVKDGELPNGGSFKVILHDFFKKHLGKALVSADSRSGFRVSDLFPDKLPSNDEQQAFLMYGHVETGKFGFESELINVETKKSKHRESTDCELIPFFFAMDFQTGEDAVILVTEQFGPYSPKGILLERLRAFVQDKLEGYKLTTEIIVSDEIVRHVLSQHVKALRFQYEKVPSDLADSIDRNKDHHIEHEGEMEVVIKAKHGAFLEWGFEFLNNVKRTGLTISDEKSTSLKVDMVVDGKQKTVNLDSPDSFNTSFIVDSIEEVQQNGHPTDERMLSESKDALFICRKALGWPIVENHVKSQNM